MEQLQPRAARSGGRVHPYHILALVLAQVITKHLVQPITRMAEHLDCIEANVPYEELIPLAHTYSLTASCGRTMRPSAGSLPLMSATS